MRQKGPTLCLRVPFTRSWGFGNDVFPGQLVYLWSPTGGLPADISGSTGDPELVFLPPTWYVNFEPTNEYLMTLKVAENALVGESYFRTLGDVTYEVNVIAPPDNPYVIATGSPQSSIQIAIDAGYSPILLSPGDYLITEPFNLSGVGIAPLVVFDGQNWASFTADPTLGSDPMFDVSRPLNLHASPFAARSWTSVKTCSGPSVRPPGPTHQTLMSRAIEIVKNRLMRLFQGFYVRMMASLQNGVHESPVFASAIKARVRGLSGTSTRLAEKHGLFAHPNSRDEIWATFNA